MSSKTSALASARVRYLPWLLTRSRFSKPKSLPWRHCPHNCTRHSYCRSGCDPSGDAGTRHG